MLLLKSFVENTGGYLSELVSKTFNLTRMSLSRANGWGLDITVLGMVAFMVAVCGDVHRTGLLRANHSRVCHRRAVCSRGFYANVDDSVW